MQKYDQCYVLCNLSTYCYSLCKCIRKHLVQQNLLPFRSSGKLDKVHQEVISGIYLCQIVWKVDKK